MAGRPSGYVVGEDSKERASRSHAFRNALVEAGEEVLRTAATGNSRRVSEVAQRRLAAVRREFADTPQITRLCAFDDEDD